MSLNHRLPVEQARAGHVDMELPQFQEGAAGCLEFKALANLDEHAVSLVVCYGLFATGNMLTVLILLGNT